LKPAFDQLLHRPTKLRLLTRERAPTHRRLEAPVSCPPLSQLLSSTIAICTLLLAASPPARYHAPESTRPSAARGGGAWPPLLYCDTKL
jgi:hypothetical protein